MSLGEERLESIRMIRDSAAALAPRKDLKRVRALRFSEPGFDRGLWRQMCAMGWVGLRVPELEGGSGLGMAELCALAEELGAALVPEPLVAGVVAAHLLNGTDLADHIAGRRLFIPAWQEWAGSLEFDGGEMRLRDGRLSGRKLFVPMAAGADAYVLSVPHGVAIVPAATEGMSRDLEQAQDGGHYATLTLAGVPVQPIAMERRRIADALDEAALATAAYLLGVAEQAFALTLEYLCTRKQFGQPIGSFQALQHRAVDLRLQLALSRASIGGAAAVLDGEAAPAARQAAVSRAKARAADAALLVTRQAVQLHGAIGYTDEFDIGLFLRKAMTLANLYGSAAQHRARYARLTPSTAEATA
ncbi:MAG: acyl-CoA dehydrogenase family protein [Nevskia sp.]|nr:acyl-CoA dehydrogenase family protein [Nevskia sp.]